MPLLFPRYAELAASMYVLANATSGTNGGFVIVAPDTVADDIVRDLRSRGYNPVVFGEVVEIGRVEVEAPKELARYVTDREVLKAFKLVEGGGG